MFGTNPQKLVLIVPFLLFGLTIHEYAHAWMAHRLGDDTAKQAGRLSLNPFCHLDFFGTLILLVTNFIGWAKPVPVDPRNFRNPAKDMSLVSVAGPAANLAVAVILALGFRFGLIEGFLSWLPFSIGSPLFNMCLYGYLINLGLAIFNLIPMPPLDGFSILAYFLPPRLAWEMQRLRLVFLIGLIILMATGAIGKIIGPLIGFFNNLLLA
ncbi:MAG: site-2 protease family protein [Deltaproteobacteria bacterium]|jgi:Zn-dependent protease|nr:site-2 protease family protein [Deltaproteobacteria bacterium]